MHRRCAAATVSQVSFLAVAGAFLDMQASEREEKLELQLGEALEKEKTADLFETK